MMVGINGGYLYVHIAHFGSISFSQSLHCLHFAPGASPIGAQGFWQWRRLDKPCHIGKQDVHACMYAYCICITFVVALVACSVSYQSHQLPGITLRLPGMYPTHVYLAHTLIASFVHYREVSVRGIWALLEDRGLAARAGRKLVAQATLELSSCIL